MHIELERSRDLGYQRQPSPQMDRFRALGIDRAVENAELQDKLEKAQNELRRAQAELRLNQSDYERSQVEMEQMQEKVRTISKFMFIKAKHLIHACGIFVWSAKFKSVARVHWYSHRAEGNETLSARYLNILSWTMDTSISEYQYFDLCWRHILSQIWTSVSLWSDDATFP